MRQFRRFKPCFIWPIFQAPIISIWLGVILDIASDFDTLNGNRLAFDTHWICPVAIALVHHIS